MVAAPNPSLLNVIRYVCGLASPGIVNLPTAPDVGVALVSALPSAIAVTTTPPSGFVPSVTRPEIEPGFALNRTVFVTSCSPPFRSWVMVVVW